MKYPTVLILLWAGISYGDDLSEEVQLSEIQIQAIPVDVETNGEHCDHGHHNEQSELVAKPTQPREPSPSGHSGHCDHDSQCELSGSSNHTDRALHDDHSGHDHRDDQAHSFWYEHDCNVFTVDDPNIGGFLFPTLYAYGAFGGSTGEQSEMASGHHDPQGSATLQSLEPAVALQTKHIQGFATASGYTDEDGEFTFVLEEGYLRLVELPGNIELRGGQFLNPFGFQNARHIHHWNFVDQNLVNGRFLNEGDLSTQGGEVVVPIPWTESSRVRTYYGGVATHGGHDHKHEEGEHLPFEAEGAEFRDEMFGVTWESELRFDDGRSIAGVVSGLWGDNAFARQTHVYGAGLEYRTIAADRPLRIRGEAMFRQVDARAGHLPGESEEEEEDHDHEEEDHDEEGGLYAEGDFATFDEFGFSGAILYSLNDCTEIGIRADWVSGVDEFGLDDRFRISPVLTWYVNEARTLQCRVQYNHDISDAYGTENSIWFQVGYNWGGHSAH